MVNKDDQIKYLKRIIEEQKSIMKEQQAKIIELEKIIEKQNEKIEELTRRLNLNSSNSGKPPSSDGLKKPPRVQSLRCKSNKKSGGQVGHEGVTLKQVANPDAIKTHKVLQCPDCETDLANVDTASICKKQVFDLPKIRPFVTEHQFEIKHCPKCKKNVQTSHEIAKAPVQYGPTSRAIVCYLNVHNLIPEKRASQIMKDVFDLPISVATVENITKSCAKTVKPIVEEIKETLKIAPVKGVDESGFRINNKTNWTHTLCNDQFVHYRVSEKRGDILEDLEGTVVHDYFSPYFSKLKNVQHAMCNAHHLRELKAVIEIDKEGWARHLVRLLRIGAKKDTQSIDPKWLMKFEKLYTKIISEALYCHENLEPLSQPKRGRIKRRPAHNLLLRLQKHLNEVLLFLRNPHVPFTNNQAEQSLRMVKVKQKVSGCFRTFKGASCFFDVKSYSATAQKQGLNILDAFFSAFNCNPIFFASARDPS